MKLPDVNVLIYAYNARAPVHDRARIWLEEALSGTETVAFAWPVLISFVRLTTREAIVEQPFTPAEALSHVASWLDQPCATLLHPTPHHLGVLRGLLEEAGTGGNLTSDAHIAALAIEHGATIYSSDRDFERFAGVRTVDPLAA